MTRCNFTLFEYEYNYQPMDLWPCFYLTSHASFVRLHCRAMRDGALGIHIQYSICNSCLDADKIHWSMLAAYIYGEFQV